MTLLDTSTPATAQCADELGGARSVASAKRAGRRRPGRQEAPSDVRGTSPSVLRERLEDGSMPIPFAGCHLWLGSLSESGYPIMKVDGRPVKGHRLSLELKLGHKLKRKTFACHTCDVRSCVNPDHLFPGTNRVNVEDKVSKGRQARVPNGGVRLSFEHAQAMRVGCDGVQSGPREQQRSISRRLVVSERQVERVRKGERWAVPVQPEMEAAE